MSVRYLQSGDEAGFLEVGGQIADDDDGGWSGLQRTFVRIALAASLAASTFAAQLAQRVQQDPEEIPAGSLVQFATPDEDCPVRPQVPPVPASIWQPLPVAAGEAADLPPAAPLAPDEDLWDNPVNPVPPSIFQELPYLEDAEEIPAGSLHGGPEEDFWQNPVASVPPALYQRLPYLPDPSDEPGQFHWIELDWTVPSGASSTDGYNIYRGTAGPGSEGSTPINASPVDVGASSGSLCTYNDCNIQWGVTYYYVIYSYDTSSGEQSTSPTNEISASYPPVLDEDYWQNPVAPLPPSVSQKFPYLPDPTDDPAGSFYGTPEETEWRSGVAPLGPLVSQALPYSPDPTDDPAGSLYGVPEETEWRSSVAPAPPCVGGGLALPWGPQGVPLQDLGDEPAGSLYGVAEETEWQNPAQAVCRMWQVASRVNPTYDLPPTIYQALPYAQSEGAEVVPSAFTPEEDYPAPSGITQISPAVSPRLPYQPDPSEDPAGSLYGVPEESEWRSGVAPAPPCVGGGLAPPWGSQGVPLQDLGDEPAGSLYGVAEETEWQNPAQAVCRMWQAASRVNPTYDLPPTIYRALPYAQSEGAEVVPSAFTPEEDYPAPSGITQISPAVSPRLPYQPDPSEDPAGSLYGGPEETEWQNPVEASRSRGVEGLRFSTFRLLDFSTSGDEAAGSLHGVPEETEWQNPVEESRSRGVEGLRFSASRLLDSSTSGAAAEIFPALVSDDDAWQNPVIPARAGRARVQPLVYDFDELTCFWWTPTWVARTHSDARARMSHSIARGRLSRSTPRARVSRGVSRQTRL